MKKPEAIIELRDIQLTYGNGKSIFRDLSFPFENGSFYLIKGPSGTGKTSLLRLLCRLEEPGSGELLYHGKPYAEYAPPFLRKKIIYMHQTPLTMSGSVKENLLFPFSFKINQEEKVPDDDTLLSYFETFMLTDISLSEKAANLSVGQLQRICFIRSLLLDPEVILLDEPTSALDEESAETVEENAEKCVRDGGKTIIMISHRPFHPKKITPRIIHMENGNIKEH